MPIEVPSGAGTEPAYPNSETRLRAGVAVPKDAGAAGTGLLDSARGGEPARVFGDRSACRRPRMPGDVRGFALRRLLAGADALALLTAGASAVALAELLGGPTITTETVVAFVALLPAWVLIANGVGLYHGTERHLHHSVGDEIGPLVLAFALWSWLFATLHGLLAGSGQLELLLMTFVWGAGLAALVGFRALGWGVAQHRPWYVQRTAILGTRADIRRVCRRLDRHPGLGLQPVCVREWGGEFSAADLDELVYGSQLNRVIIASPPEEIRLHAETIRRLTESHVHLDLVVSDPGAAPVQGHVNYLEGIPMFAFPAVRVPRSYAGLKRACDVVAAIGGLIALSPLLAYCAVRIKLGSPGPVLYRQQRIGRNREAFEILKFRTMHVGSQDAKRHLAGDNMHEGSGTPGMFKVANDPRVTRFGAWLRRWSLDELPQLWNVLKGEMSLVGPRPLIDEESSLISDDFGARFSVRPGMTGPWQTLGRSEIGLADMVRLDRIYVSNRSLSEDAKLLLRTVGAVLRGRGAY